MTALAKSWCELMMTDNLTFVCHLPPGSVPGMHLHVDIPHGYPGEGTAIPIIVPDEVKPSGPEGVLEVRVAIPPAILGTYSQNSLRNRNVASIQGDPNSGTTQQTIVPSVGSVVESMSNNNQTFHQGAPSCSSVAQSLSGTQTCDSTVSKNDGGPTVGSKMMKFEAYIDRNCLPGTLIMVQIPSGYPCEGKSVPYIVPNSFPVRPRWSIAHLCFQPPPYVLVIAQADISSSQFEDEEVANLTKGWAAISILAWICPKIYLIYLLISGKEALENYPPPPPSPPSPPPFTHPPPLPPPPQLPPNSPSWSYPSSPPGGTGYDDSDATFWLPASNVLGLCALVFDVLLFLIYMYRTFKYGAAYFPGVVVNEFYPLVYGKKLSIMYIEDEFKPWTKFLLGFAGYFPIVGLIAAESNHQSISSDHGAEGFLLKVWHVVIIIKLLVVRMNILDTNAPRTSQANS